MIQSVVKMEDWEKILQQSNRQPVFFLKHSTQCPISAKAYAQFVQFSQELANQDVGFFYVKVIEDRPTSLAIADATGVKHASPQVMLVDKGKVIWHTSHFDITVSNLLQAFEDQQ